MQLKRMLLLVGWASLALACGRSAGAAPFATNVATPVAEVCAGSGCAELRLDSDIGFALCPDGALSVARDAASSSTLVICDCRCTSHDNTGWVVLNDGSSGVRSVVPIFPGMMASPEMFSANTSPTINDLVVGVPMCTPVDRAQLKQSTFITLSKRPSESTEFPYCFDPLYILAEGSMVKLKLGSRWIDPNDAEFFGRRVLEEDLNRLYCLLGDDEVAQC